MQFAPLVSSHINRSTRLGRLGLRGWYLPALLIGALILLPSMCWGQVQYVPGISDVVGTPPDPVTGTAQTGYSGDGGPASLAKLNSPYAVTFDAAGNMYVADGNNYAVRRIDTISGVITTVAGNGTSTPVCTDGQKATSCAIGQPFGVAVDAAGNIFISDKNANIVRKVDASTGNIARYAGTGTSGTTYTADALNSNLKGPSDLQLDAAGNLYITNQTGNVVVKVAAIAAGTPPTHALSKYAATGTGGYLDATVNQSSTAKVNNVYGFTFDAAGNMYLADTKNYVIRKVDASGPAGAMTTVVGNYSATAPTVPQPNNVAPRSTGLVYPQRVFADPAGNLYIADSSDYSIRRVDKDFNAITMFAGMQASGYSSNGAALASRLRSPFGMAMDSSGNFYFADGNNALIRKIAFNNQFATQNVGSAGVTKDLYAQIDPTLSAGLTVQSFGIGAGFSDFSPGTVTGCTLGANNAAAAICTVPVTFTPTAPGLRTAPLALVDSTGVSYVTGVFGIANAPAVAFTPGIMTTLAGAGAAGWTGDGSTATAALLSAPTATAVDGAGNIYVADAANNAVRKIAGGVITTIAGNGTAGFLGDGSPAVNAQLSNPLGVALDASGNIYIADAGNNRVRMISAQTATISTIAGNGIAGSTGDGSTAKNAELSNPSAVAVDTFGNIFIADTGNNRIREVSGGNITTVVGDGNAAYKGDGGAATAAELNGPSALALDAAGNLFIADTQNGAVREVAKNTGVINTIGTATSPSGVAVDAAGNVYFADSSASLIKVISAATGTASVVAGNGSAGFSGDGAGSLSGALNHATGVTVDGAGKLYIADTANNRIRLVDVTAPVLNFGQQTVQTTSAAQTLTVTNIGNQLLTLSGLSVAANFNEGSFGNECTSTSSLAPGTSCNITVSFTPADIGDVKASVVLTDNALNATGAQQTVALNGSGVMIPTGLTMASLPATSAAGTPQSFTVTSQMSGETVTSYAGTVHFTSTDANAALPADYAFVPVDQGTHTFTVTFKTAGQQTVTVVDTLMPSVTGNQSTTVTAGTPATITASAGASQTAQVNTAFPARLQATVVDQYQNPVSGVTVTFTAPGSGASGTFAGGGTSATAVSDASGLATAPVLTANGTGGAFAVTASVAGVSTTTSFVLTISSQIVPTVGLTLTPATSSLPYGSSAILGATVSPAAAVGSISFYDNCVEIGNATPLVSGGATLNLGTLATGPHSYTANYNSGDGTYSNSSSLAPLALAVTTAGVTLAGPTQPVTVSAGQSQSVTITITGQFSGQTIAAPTGSLSYQIDSATAQAAPISNGQATLNVPNTLTGGSHSIGVSYPGDTNYQAASLSVAVSVAQLSQIITFAPIATHKYGDAPLTLSASSNSGLPVTFKVVSGPASLSGTTLMLLGGGTVTIEADAAGNQIYTAAAPVQQSFVVNPASTSLALTSVSTIINPGDSVTFTATLTATVPGTPSGTVTFSDNGSALGTAPITASGSNYVASYTTTKLTSGGAHSITAVYGGDQTFATSTSSPYTLTVNAPDFSFSSNSPSLTVMNGAAGILNLTLTPSGKYAKAVTFTCSNLPAKTTCVFTPNPVSLTTTPVTLMVAVQTTPTNGLLSEMRRPLAPGAYWPVMPAAVFFLPSGLLGSLAAFGRKSMTGKSRRVILLLALIVLMIGLSACGGTSAKTTNSSPVGTPTGTTTFTINASDGTNTHSINVSMTVN